VTPAVSDSTSGAGAGPWPTPKRVARALIGAVQQLEHIAQPSHCADCVCGVDEQRSHGDARHVQALERSADQIRAVVG